MKKLLALAVLCMSFSASSFGAEHVITHSAKVVGHESYKTAKHVADASVKAVKFLV